jgi:hypothetical protein
MARTLTLPLLEARLQDLQKGGFIRISREDYRNLFGFNDAAMGRLRNFARGHQCIASFADSAVLFRKRTGSADKTPQATP